MPRKVYETKKFRPEARAIIRAAIDILESYAEQGFDLTLRQLYYQFVARDLFANNERNYKKLGSIVSDARLAGYIDWDSIVDRTRNVRRLPSWETPEDIVDQSAKQFHVDMWKYQDKYVEVWIEKDALVGVIKGISNELDTPHFSCRGYTSQSEMWSASQRILRKVIEGKQVTILHLGDHDPSGIDMTRDIEDRLRMFVITDYVRHMAIEDEITPHEALAKGYAEQAADTLEIRRIALTIEQIDRFSPPPNPAKMSDSRFASYLAEYGDESWELDALEPTVLAGLVEEHTTELIDDELWGEDKHREDVGKRLLARVSEDWDQIVENLK